jgi:endonuclease YncB( thermonuclease family)
VILATLAVVAAAVSCPAAPPQPGLLLRGQGRHVAAGDSFCLGASADPTGWVRVRLADFRAPEPGQAGGHEAQAALRKLVIGRPVICRVLATGPAGAVGLCSADGRTVGGRMRSLTRGRSGN